MKLETAPIQRQIEIQKQLRDGAFLRDEAKRANEICIESKDGAHGVKMVNLPELGKADGTF